MIRTRLAAWNALVLAFVLTLIGVIVYYTTARNLYGTVDANLEKAAERIQHGMSRDWGFLISRRRPPANDRQEGRGERYGPDRRALGLDGGSRIPGPHGPPPDDRGLRHGPRAAPPFMMMDQNSPPPPPEGELKTPQGLTPEQARRMKIEWLLSRVRVVTARGEGLWYEADRAWDADLMRRSLAGRKVFGETSLLGERVRLLSVPIRYQGKIVGVAQAAASLEQTDQLMSKEGRTLLALLPLALILTSLTGIYLTNYALRPVRDIARTAEKIEATSLSGRLNLDSHDEFGALASVINSMLARLEASFHRLEDAYESQRRFIADASHELKTPLTAIKTRVGVAKRGAQTAERYQEHMVAIGVSADSMAAIVQNLLLLAKSDEGKLDLRRSDTPLLAIADEAATLVRGPSRAKLELDIPADMDVCVDHALFQRVLTNLFSNAVRHTPTDGLVRLTAHLERRSVVIEVTDDGEGIPAEHVPHVFERFHRVDAARTRESGGTGLGLPIAKSIVEAHGGTIALSSVFGEGTTVRIVLPA